MIDKICRWACLTILLYSCGQSTTPSQSVLEWRDVDGVSIPVPPAEHPRLFLRLEHVSGLQRRIEHPVLQPVWQRLQAMAEGELMYRVERDAFLYLLTGDRETGRSAAENAVELMQQEHWNPDLNVNQNSRVYGRIMTSAAIAYDWCHDLLRPEERQAIIDYLVTL